MSGILKPCPKKYDKHLYKCHHYCENRSYKTKYYKDLTFGQAPYYVTDEKEIMAELMTNGPMTSEMMVYEDFINYKSGVYKYVKGKIIAHHFVRVLGWGEENGNPYWLVANSWGSDWGDHGLFKVIRDKDDKGSLAYFMVAALPEQRNYKN